MDLGAPISYLVLEPGTPVYAPDGSEVGRVEHVLAAEEEDIFEGLLVDARAGPGGWRFADAGQVAALHEHGVRLGVRVEDLHEPTANPVAMGVDPALAEEGMGAEIERKLRRAWDYLSGNY